MAPAEPDADIALVPPDDLTADGWASDWGVDVLAPDDLTAAAFGLTNGHLAVVDEPQVEAQPDELVEASDAESVVAEGEPVPAEAIDAEPIEPDEAGTPEPIEDALGVADVVIGPEAAPDDEVALVAAAEFPADAEPIAIEVDSVEEPVAFDIELAIGALEPVAATTETVAQVVAPPSPVVRPAAAPRPAKAAGKKRPKSKASAFKWPAQASCPYCAQLLVPAPTTHKRCPRCRQRVMVRRVEDRVAFLTEASVAIFESERRRVAESKHWIGPRNQWIRLAEAAGARPDKVAKVNESLATPESVYAARSVYFAAVDRSVKDARADHDWPLAVRIRRAQAAAVSKLEGSPIPPPDDAVELHRDAAAIGAARHRGAGEGGRARRRAVLPRLRCRCRAHVPDQRGAPPAPSAPCRLPARPLRLPLAAERPRSREPRAPAPSGRPRLTGRPAFRHLRRVRVLVTTRRVLGARWGR